HRPTHVAVAFDTRAPTFRDEIYKTYKAQRPPIPDDLHAQIPMVKELMAAFRVPCYEKDGYEADDIVGTVCRTATESGVDTLIVTGDVDQLQLVSPSVRLLMYTGFANTKVYDVDAFRERFGGLGPESLPDIKGLRGDPSDNIPGVPGVGEKTSLELLKGPRHLKALYENLDAVAKLPIRGVARVKESLEQHRDQAFASRDLTTIRRDVPVEFRFEDAEFWRYDRAEVIKALQKLEFRTILSQVPDVAPPPGAEAVAPSAPETGTQLALGTEAPAGPTPAAALGKQVRPPPAGAEYAAVTTPEALDSLLDTLRTPAGFAFDTETSGLNAMDSTLVGISFSTADGRAWYVPLGHKEGVQLPASAALDALKPLFADSVTPKFTHNGNFDMTVLEEAGLRLEGVTFDSMIAAALAGRRAIGLKELALDCYGHEMTPITALIGTGRKQITFDRVTIEEATAYACADADFTWRLKHFFDPELDRNGVRGVFADIEMPLLPVIVRMQRHGILVEVPVLEAMGQELAAELAKVEADARQLVGEKPVNLNANQQLASILFDDLGVSKTKRTKTGYAMDASVLEDLRERPDLRPEAFELIGLILKHRELSKLKSTYVDALPTLVNKRTGRVHTSFNQVGSATGRLSSTEPNVQNIPVRTELGRRVRKAFVADRQNGWTLLAADYSQIELRILAHMSQEPNLLEAFHQGEDIHAATARAMYEVDKVTSDQRRIAKILNFGVIYGLSAHGVAVQTDLSREQGRQFIEMYFSKYPGIKGYLDSVVARARQVGYVETITGRRRRLPEINAPNFQIRSAAERMAVNMPIQGTAADIIKKAMIEIDRELTARKMRSKMLIQVHDELIFEAAPGELEDLEALVGELMPRGMTLSVPLTIEIKTGPTWGDLE
ncbi:MAG: DNA polymerase I, partial [Chloroflexi bacterium]|nr:DNA polymerase I [Chloroflexota bacterium]